MKQKYTLTIADMQINVVTDAPESSIEHIVGILDRKVRDILLKSKRCSRNEAALLCALDFCADKIQLKDELDELAGELEGVREELQAACAKAEKAERAAEDLENAKVRLEGENKRLYDLLEKATAGNAVTAEEVSAAKQEPADTYAEEAVETTAEESAPAEAVEEEKPAPAQKKKGARNRVGSMFDLLTFSDI